MGCCCSNDSESETLEKTNRGSSKYDESYNNPLMYGKEVPTTYGATSETIERYKYDSRSPSADDGESVSTTHKSDDDTIHDSQCKSESTSRKGKKLKRGLKKILKKKDGKGQSQSAETSESQLGHSKKKTTRLNYQDITSIREIERQKRANNRAKDLEAKKANKAMSEALEKAHERGEKLDKLQDKTAELRAHSESFAENARKLLEREEQKHLGLAKKSKKQQNT